MDEHGEHLILYPGDRIKVEGHMGIWTVESSYRSSDGYLRYVARHEELDHVTYDLRQKHVDHAVKKLVSLAELRR